MSDSLPAFASWLTANEPAVRLGVFLVLFSVLAGLEWLFPRRTTVRRRGRWLPNVAMLAVDALALRLLFPLLAVGVSVWAEATGVGLMHWLAIPWWPAFVACLLALDLAIWAQHLVMHKVPWLWRMHRVHHTDLEFDVSTAVRFHPAEIVLSMLFKMGVVALLGAPAAAVIAFEVLLNATALFNHANLTLPPWLDRAARWVVVTPDMHRVHHSVHREETDSNYGFNLPWWDRLFGTYRAQPRDGHSAMLIGLGYFRAARDQRFGLLLIQPVRRVRDNDVVAGGTMS